MLDVRAAGVFAEADVTDPVQAIFDAPVAAIEFKQIGGSRPLDAEAGDRVSNLRRDASLLQDGAFDAADLLQTRPIKDFGQTRTGLQMPLRYAAVSFVDSAMLGQLCLAFAFAIGGRITMILGPAEIRLRSPPSARVGCL